MLVRVQQIDGTLEPAVPRRDSEFLIPIGTSFAMPDRRWVQVLGYAHGDDGALDYVIVGELFERRSYSATAHEAYVHGAGEMRMGSPQYGTLMLDGSPFDVDARVDQESLLWSHDGRYLAATVLDSSMEYPATKVVVIDADSRTVVASSDSLSGLDSPLDFVGRSLSYRHWHDVDRESSRYLPF